MNVRTSLLYGQDDIMIDLPDQALVIEPVDLPGIPDDVQAIGEALRDPIGTSSLHTLVRADQTVAIVISDITRPTPNHILVPVIINELHHVPLENFVIINGMGTHRDQTKEEFEQMLGKWIVRSEEHTSELQSRGHLVC